MKTSEALRRTKKMVWDGEPSRRSAGRKFICFAATRALPAKNALVVQMIVMRLLAGTRNLESWLHWKMGISYGRLDRNPQRVQATRHAWLDHLIEHYESIGD